jgi:hypothetical protein
MGLPHEAFEGKIPPFFLPGFHPEKALFPYENHAVSICGLRMDTL